MRTDKEFIEYLRKELVDLLYERKMSSDVMNIFHKLIHKWEEICQQKEK